eukprot:4430727-Prymnesium_polylepis.1
MSGREVFEGNHERMGAHVIKNAKLAQPPPPRAGPNRPTPRPGRANFAPGGAQNWTSLHPPPRTLRWS